VSEKKEQEWNWFCEHTRVRAFEPHEQHSHADYNHAATKLYLSAFPTVERLFNETSAKFGSISAS